MKNKPLVQLLAALAFCVSSIGLMSTAQASYTIVIDCHGTNGIPTWAPTSDDITVDVWFQGVLTDSHTFHGFTFCNVDDGGGYISGSDRYAAGITKIRITTNGTNEFFLDKLIVRPRPDVPGGDGALQWGADNNVGWCFSTQSTDGNSSHCLGGVAYKSKEFVR